MKVNEILPEWLADVNQLIFLRSNFTYKIEKERNDEDSKNPLTSSVWYRIGGGSHIHELEDKTGSSDDRMRINR